VAERKDWARKRKTARIGGGIVSRIDCISTRNTRIIATYVSCKLGHHETLFEGLPYPNDRYASPDDFFLNEDEWTTLENCRTVLRRGKDLLGEPHFFFQCGASCAGLRSWGRLDYFARVFTSPNDGFKRLPEFNRHFNDTLDFEVLVPPFYDKALGKIRTLLEVRYHDDVDVHKDYIRNPYLRGILSSIPTIWGLKPALVRQPLSPYDPEILFNDEPEFTSFGLDLRSENNHLIIRDPDDGHRKVVGKRVLLTPEFLNGRPVYMGRHCDFAAEALKKSSHHWEALLITETIRNEHRILLRAGEIFKAPCFILDVTYDAFSWKDRISQLFRLQRTHESFAAGLIETINQLRETNEARNIAYQELQKANAELTQARNRLDDYARNLESMVSERTAELHQAKEELLQFNLDLKAKVDKQVKELRRYHELRRYLSPQLSERILSLGSALGAEPLRKMMTVVFTDIRNFSSLTENLEPEELFQLLDTYLSEMTTLVHRYDGTLNKINGDGMLIFFGDPIPLHDHAQRAVMMAVDMQSKAHSLRYEWLQYGHELGLGIGINTGYMSVGNIGSDTHKDYTVIGNQVNVAARLESLAKPGQILISQRTYSRVKDMVGVEEVGHVQVKGLSHPVLTYNVKIPQNPSEESAWTSGRDLLYGGQ
jgi:class 3 adenylate cyclase